MYSRCIVVIRDPRSFERRGAMGLSLATYSIVVNQEQSVEDALIPGSFDWVSEAITSAAFPPIRTGTAEMEIILVHFGRDLEPHAVIRELPKHGLEEVGLREILALAAAHPDLQRNFPIAGLASKMLCRNNGTPSRICAHLAGNAA